MASAEAQGSGRVATNAAVALQAMAGHAIVGDPEYCKLPEVREEDVFEGWMLHGMYLFASELRFEHPVGAEQLAFCVQPPQKFEQPVGRRKKKRHRRQEQALANSMKMGGHVQV